jgi:hypothetical protein
MADLNVDKTGKCNLRNFLEGVIRKEKEKQPILMQRFVSFCHTLDEILREGKDVILKWQLRDALGNTVFCYYQLSDAKIKEAVDNIFHIIFDEIEKINAFSFICKSEVPSECKIGNCDDFLRDIEIHYPDLHEWSDSSD